MKLSRFLRVLLAWAGLAGVFPEARAHDPGLSVAQAVIRAETIELTTAFAPADAGALLPADKRPAKWTAAEFEAVKPALLQLAPTLWEVRAGGEVLVAGNPRVQLTEKSDSVEFRLTFRRGATGGPVVFRGLKFEGLPPGHREYFTVENEQTLLAEKLLYVKSPSVEVVLTPARATQAAAGEQAPSPSFWGFLKLGVEHIWTGYDHLLFLFGLLVVCRTFRSIVGIITCFTVAHSLTLALATLNVVNLPSRVVEPLIAASIVFVGVENLLRRGAEPKGRWALTFVFGLIHGFGFASVLRELGVGEGGRGLAMPLFTFNFGVELGQIAIAAVVLPIVWRLRKNETFLRRGVPVLSAIVALAGLYWLLERTVFA
ncbi:MAG TPA: HupE/UreJ family protein [Opitutaceae bacterium]|nr:HupE/UreJ family protein [Opitutaceae bacterium]